MLLLHYTYLVKCRSRSLAVYSNESYYTVELWVAHVWAQKIIVRQQNHCKSVTYVTLTYRTKISDVDELKRRIISEWAALSHAVTDSAVKELRQRLRACVRAGGGHFEHTPK